MLKLSFFKKFNAGSILFSGLLLSFFAFSLSGCLKDDNLDEVNKQAMEAYLKQLGEDTVKIKDVLADSAFTNVKRTQSGIFYIEKVVGPGAQAQNNSRVRINYTLKSLEGALIETTKTATGSTPAEFPLGGTIPGFREGLSLMKVGGKTKLFIPSGLAYGPQGSGSKIGPNMILVFDVELIEIR
jgi:FKBP-type peptidyl-prolyl cis-trans isomerase FklB